MASPAVDFARSNQQRFLNELKDLLRIPSVSTLEQHKSDIHKAADYVANELRRIGLENVEVIPTSAIRIFTPAAPSTIRASFGWRSKLSKLSCRPAEASCRSM